MDAATKCGGHDMPKEEPDQERFERIAAAYLAESEIEGLISIRFLLLHLFCAMLITCHVAKTFVLGEQTRENPHH